MGTVMEGLLAWQAYFGNKYGLGRCDAHKFTHVIFVHKGLVWFLLVAVAEVPPTVRLGILLAPHFPSSSRFRATGVYLFELQWYLHSLYPATDEH